MNFKPTLLLCLILFLLPFEVLLAYETDQYTVSPYILSDSGVGFSKFIYQELDQGISEVNANLKQLPERIEEIKKERELLLLQFPRTEILNLPDDARNSVQYMDQQLDKWTRLYKQLQSEIGIVEFIHAKFAWRITWQDQRDGVFRIPIDLWPLGENAETFKYHAGRLETVYTLSGFHRIVSPSIFVIASTYKMYGVQLGWDKVGHILNQGFEYFEKFHSELINHSSIERAFQKAIEIGVNSEDGIFGQFVDGVFSNADLAANFAGFAFYQNFFHGIVAGDKILKPLFMRDDKGQIAWNPENGRTAESFMKDFISDHLNESLNPGVLERPQRGIVRRAIENRCESWKKYYGIHSYSEIVQRVQNLRTWFGYDYGHRSEGSLPIENICFRSEN